MILSPSKYSPSTATHLCQRLIQLSKHFWNSIIGIAIRAVFDFSITSFRQLKRIPRNGFLTRSNRKKSQGAISDEFDGCWMVFVSFLVNSRIMMALCDGALSWCKIHKLFAHKSKLENTCRERCTQDGVIFTNVKLWIKFGNVNDRCGNLIKKTELKSVDSEHLLVVITGTFWSRWYNRRAVIIEGFRAGRLTTEIGSLNIRDQPLWRDKVYGFRTIQRRF